MAYVLRGVIAAAPALGPSRAFANGVVVELGQGLGLTPMTLALFDELRRGDEVDARLSAAQLFPPRFEVMLADGHYDEFDAVGLGRHRHVEGWLAARPPS